MLLSTPDSGSPETLLHLHCEEFICQNTKSYGATQLLFLDLKFEIYFSSVSTHPHCGHSFEIGGVKIVEVNRSRLHEI